MGWFGVPSLSPSAPVPLLEPRPLPMRPMRSRDEQARLLWAYGLGDTGTAWRDQLGFYSLVFLPESPVWPGLMAGLVRWDPRLGRHQQIPSWAGLSGNHTKSRLGRGCPGPDLECPCRWGWRWPPNWWVPPAGLAEFALLWLIAFALPGDVFTCGPLPYSALAAAHRRHQLRTRSEHGALPGSILPALSGPRAFGARLVADGTSGYLMHGASPPPADHSGPWAGLGVLSPFTGHCLRRPTRRIPSRFDASATHWLANVVSLRVLGPLPAALCGACS